MTRTVRHSPFLRLPVAAQNVAITAASFVRHKQRYGGAFERIVALLEQSQYWPADRVLEFQTNSLRELISQALHFSPYYSNTGQIASRCSQIVPDDLRHLFPVVTKQDVRKHLGQIRTKQVPSPRVVTLGTSGSTGTPLRFPMTIAGLRWNYAFFGRFLRWHAVRETSRTASFGGRVLMSPDQRRPPFWRKDLIGHRWLFSTYHISADTVRSYIDALHELQPEIIDGYPSSLAALCRFASAQGLRMSYRPRAVITTAESLTPSYRRDIERFFGSQVRDQYGCAEQVINAAQCDHGSYHLSPECGVVEVLDEHEQPCPPGHTGTLVVTGFHNLAFPLIRYAVGDKVTFSDKPCSCGRTLPVIAAIDGRSDDGLKFSDGRVVGRLAHILSGIDDIRECQFVQRSPKHVDVLVVCERDFYAVSRTIEIRLRERVPNDVTIAIHQVANIPRSSNGKVQFVIREFK